MVILIKSLLGWWQKRFRSEDRWCFILVWLWVSRKRTSSCYHPTYRQNLCYCNL